MYLCNNTMINNQEIFIYPSNDELLYATEQFCKNVNNNYNKENKLPQEHSHSSETL